MAKRKTSFITTNIPSFSNAKKQAAIATIKSNGEQSIMKGDDVIRIGKRVYDYLPAETKEAARDKTIEYIKRNANERLKRKIRTRPNMVSGSGREEGGDVLFSDRSSGRFALSQAPNPKQVSLNTGIQPNTYTSDYMQAIENKCAPLHINCAKLQFPNYAASKLFNYFNNVIVFDLQTKAQANVGFNLNINTDFTATNILAAFNSLITALQVYFYHMSIISYHSDPSNKNEGMIYLRNQFTSQMIEDLSLLGRRLADTPCPPKLLEYVRYLSATYYSGNTSGSPLLKISPIPGSSTLTSTTAISTALTALATSTNNQIFSLMRRAVPQWTPKVLFDPEPIPFYDANFRTIFANMPFIHFNGTTAVNYPSVTSLTDSVTYNTFTSELDGGAFALAGMYDNTNTAWVPGLIVPISGTGNFVNNRVSFYQVGSVSSFYPSHSYDICLRSRLDSIAMNGNTAVPLHPVGSNMCQNVSANTVTETSYQVLDYLMSLDTIKNSTVRKPRSRGR